MKLFRLLLLAAAAAYIYKRFVADSGAGLAETQAAEPFSSEQLADEPAPASSQATVVRPTPVEGSAPAAGNGS